MWMSQEKVFVTSNNYVTNQRNTCFFSFFSLFLFFQCYFYIFNFFSIFDPKVTYRLADKEILIYDHTSFFFFFFFYQRFLSRTLTTHRTAGEGRGPSFSFLPLPPAHEHSDIYLQLCT